MRVATVLFTIGTLGGCTLEGSLGSTHLVTPDASSAGSGDSPAQPMGTIAYPYQADALLEDPDGLLFLGRVIDGQPMPHGGSSQEVALMRLTPDGYTIVAEIPYANVHPTMARDDEAVYVAVQFPDPDPYGSDTPRQGIVAIDHTTQTLRIVTSGWETIEQIAARDGFIYFTQNLGRDAGRLVRIGIDGSNPRVLIEGLDSPMRVHVDASYIYVPDDLNHRVLAVATTGNAQPLVIARNVNRPSDAMPHAGWLYITEWGDTQSDGRISRVPLPPPHAQQADLMTSPQTLVSELAHPAQLAFGSGYVYWTGYWDGLHRAPLDGGAAELVVPSYVLGCWAIATQGENVYFTSRYPNNTGGLIYTAPLETAPL